MEWIQNNWALLLPLAILAADKIVAKTPTPYDDIIFTAIKGVVKLVKKNH